MPRICFMEGKPEEFLQFILRKLNAFLLSMFLRIMKFLLNNLATKSQKFVSV